LVAEKFNLKHVRGYGTWSIRTIAVPFVSGPDPLKENTKKIQTSKVSVWSVSDFGFSRNACSSVKRAHSDLKLRHLSRLSAMLLKRQTRQKKTPGTKRSIDFAQHRSFLHLERQLDQAADGFGKRWLIWLLFGPPNNGRSNYPVSPEAHQGSNAGARPAYDFLFNRRCFLHTFLYNKR
jgi:hypothetical protein